MIKWMPGKHWLLLFLLGFSNYLSGPNGVTGCGWDGRLPVFDWAERGFIRRSTVCNDRECWCRMPKMCGGFCIFW